MQAHRPNHVFIVDDSAAIRARLIEILARNEDVRIVGEADSAREAIARIRRIRPDCVVLDLNLMGRSGLEVLKAIHAELPEIVFVVLSNHAEPQYRRACAQAGAAHFLDKSIEFDRVSGVLSGIATQP